MKPQMPEMDGFEATTIILDFDAEMLSSKAKENVVMKTTRTSSLPVFALTGLSASDISTQAREAGMTKILQKPIARDSLRHALRSVQYDNDEDQRQ